MWKKHSKDELPPKEVSEKEKAAKATGKKTLRVGGYSVMACLIVLAICIALNILIDKLPGTAAQLDLSSNKVYSLSQESKDLLKDLEEDVTVYWLVQNGKEDAPVENLLSRYESAGKKLTVKRIDPDEYPNFAEQYSMNGTVYNNSLIIECGDANRYIPYQDLYSTSYDSSGTTRTTFAGESQITSGIRYVTSSEHPVIYVLTGHGEQELQASFRSAVEGQNFTMTSLSLLSAGEVPADGALLLINTPSTDISAEEKGMIQSYLQNGGKLFLITDITSDGTELTNIKELMADYGVTAHNGILVEQNAENFVNTLPYCLLPDLNGSHTITQPLAEAGYRVMLPVAQGLTVGEMPRESVEVTQLMTTSDRAFSKNDGVNMTSYEKADGDEDGPFAVGVAVTEAVENGTTEIVWVSSGAIQDEQSNEQVSGGNQDFFLNAISWLYGGENGEVETTIHAKAFDYGYLTMSSSTGTILALLMVLVIPLGWLIVGAVVRSRRKRQ